MIYIHILCTRKLSKGYWEWRLFYAKQNGMHGEKKRKVCKLFFSSSTRNAQ